MAARVADGALESIDRTFEDGEVYYEVDFTAKNGRELTFDLGEDGRVSFDVTLAETPAAVQKTASQRLGKGTLTGVEESIEGAETSFDFDVATYGREWSFSVGADGALTSTGVTLAEVPPAAQKMIALHVGVGKLDSLEEKIDGRDISYEVNMTTKDNQKWDFTVDGGGNLLRSGVSIEQIPAAAMKTILNKLGGGKILRIEQSYVKEKKVLPFEVDGVKDGQPFDFSVGPGGRFLGMDE